MPATGSERFQSHDARLLAGRDRHGRPAGLPDLRAGPAREILTPGNSEEPAPMTINGWTQILLYCLVIIAITAPFGGYMTRVFAGERTLLSPVLRPVERVLYRLSGVDETAEQYWVSYAIAVLAFSFAGFVSLYALQRLQNLLPFNPAGQTAISPGSSFNTSVS